MIPDLSLSREPEPEPELRTRAASERPHPQNDRETTMSFALLRLPDALPLKRLPAALQKKIALEVPNANEENCCWIWTGFKTKPRVRFRDRSGVNDENYQGNRESAGSFGREKAMPMVRWPGRTNAIPAHRAVFARTYKLPIGDVPYLRRCVNPDCVSPHHVTVIEPNPNAKATKPSELFRAPAEPLPAPVEPASPPKPPVADVEAVLAKLRAAEVSHHLSTHLAAEAAGIDPVLLTGDIWKVYWHECDEAENALDDGDEDD